MNHRRILSSFAIFSLLLAMGLGFGGCGRDAGVTSPTELTHQKGGGGGPLFLKQTYLVEFTDEVAARAILAQERAIVTQTLEDIEVLVVEGGPDLLTNVENRNSPALFVELPLHTGLTDGTELVMVFLETFRPQFDYAGAGGLDVLDLTTIHTAGQGDGVDIAMLDTAVDFSHPYLAGHLQSTSVTGLESPMLQYTSNPTDPKAYGHGTTIAGLMASVAPGADIHPFTVLNEEGFGTTEELAIAMNAIYDMQTSPSGQKFDIINMSLSIAGDSQIIRNVIGKLATHEDYPVHVMCAAGNTGLTTGLVLNPAAYTGAIAIGATVGDAVADFSAEGDVDLGAPGAAVVSAYPGGEMWESSGTSMASAVAAGALAILMGPVQTQADIDPPLQRLYDTADAITSDGPGFLHGRLSLLRSLQMFSVPGN